jgi:hypothetical protein
MTEKFGKTPKIWTSSTCGGSRMKFVKLRKVRYAERGVKLG